MATGDESERASLTTEGLADCIAELLAPSLVLECGDVSPIVIQTVFGRVFPPAVQSSHGQWDDIRGVDTYLANLARGDSIL